MTVVNRDTLYHEALREGRCAIGTVCALDGNAVAHLLASLGLDFLLVDRQHAAFTWPSLEDLAWRVRSTRTALYVRTAGASEEELNLTIDLPIDGLIVPNIETFDDAQRALETCLMSPRGHRSLGNVRNAPMLGYDFRTPPDPEIGLLIEHIDAVEAIDEIIKLSGLGMVFLGPHDLAVSMQIDTNTEAHAPRELTEAMDRVREASRRQGIPYWAWSGSLDQTKGYVSAGVDAVLHSVDGLLLADAVRETMRELRT